MKIIAVDDEQPALNVLCRAIREAVTEVPECFRNPMKALDFAKENQVDVAFLDVNMCGMDGLTLAYKLKELQPRANIIFVTGYSEYMSNAFTMHASGYIFKPVKTEDVARELEDLRYPVERKKKGIWVQTFGNFDIFVDEKPIYFSRTKSKEILAYLIDRKGAGVTKKELAAVIWEDGSYSRSRQNYLHILIAEMMAPLKMAGAEQIVISKRNYYAICPSEFECDYYNYLKWDVQAINSFQGEYMSNYSWAEFTLGLLDSR